MHGSGHFGVARFIGPFVFTVIAVVAVGFIVVKPALAQVDATSTEAVLQSDIGVPTDQMEASSTTNEEPGVPQVADTVAVASDTPSTISTEAATGDATAIESTTTENIPISEEILEPASTAPVTESQPIQQVQQAVPTGTLILYYVDCDRAYTGTLYDTPSGHLDAGYYDAANASSTAVGTPAHVVGEQSWTVCHDDLGKTYEFPMTGKEYADLAVGHFKSRQVMMPLEYARENAIKKTTKMGLSYIPKSLFNDPNDPVDDGQKQPVEEAPADNATETTAAPEVATESSSTTAAAAASTADASTTSDTSDSFDQQATTTVTQDATSTPSADDTGATTKSTPQPAIVASSTEITEVVPEDEPQPDTNASSTDATTTDSAADDATQADSTAASSTTTQ